MFEVANGATSIRSRKELSYERLNSIVMGIIYSPLLLLTAWIEKRDAGKIIWNRRRGEEDDDTFEEWEVLNWWPEGEESNGMSVSMQGDKEWCRLVEETSPNPAKEPVLEEVKMLRKEVEELKVRLAEKTGNRKEND